MRPLRFLLTVLTVTLFVLRAAAQAANTTNSSSQPDPASAQLIHLALEAMGGSDAWNSVHASDLQGTVSDGSSTGITNIHWVDTWQKGGQMRRSKNDRSGKALNFTADSEAPDTTGVDSKSQKIKKNKYDPVSQLITHMPAAALTVSTRGGYNISTTLVPPHETAADCIQIERDKRNLMGGGVQVTLCLDKTTHLPTVAYLSVANPLHPGNSLKERIAYGTFRRVQGLSVPATVAVRNPVGQTMTYSFSSIVLNPQNPEINVPGGQQ